MLSVLKMDCFRLIKGKLFWVCLAIAVAVVVISLGTFWWIASPGFSAMMMQAQQSAAQSGTATPMPTVNGVAMTDFTLVSPTWLYGQVVSSTPILVVIIMALLMSADYEKGFIKNIFSARFGRLSFFVEKLVITVVISAIFVLIEVAIAELLRLALGLSYTQSDSAGQLLAWLGLSILTTSAYGLITAAVVSTFHSKAAALIVGVFVATNIIGSLLRGAFSLLGQATPFFKEVPNYLLSTSTSIIDSGAPVLFGSGVSTLRVVLVLVAYVVVALACLLAIGPRRDV